MGEKRRAWKAVRVERAVPVAGWVRTVSRCGLGIQRTRLAVLSKRERRQFLRLVPEFVIEVMSPSDRLAAAQKKMRLWAGNGVELGWLIDADNRCVYVYRGTAEPRLVTNADNISGEGPVESFVL